MRKWRRTHEAMIREALQERELDVQRRLQLGRRTGRYFQALEGIGRDGLGGCVTLASSIPALADLEQRVIHLEIAHRIAERERRSGDH